MIGPSRMRVVNGWVLLLTLALTAVASAQPARAPGVQTHDGFYLRLQLGVGYTSMWSSMNGTNRSLAGTGTGSEIALGAALNRHVIIYGTLIDSTARHPDGHLSGRPPDTNGHGLIGSFVDNGHGAAGVTGGGPGVAYYLDSNVFFAGSLLGSILLVNDIYGGYGARSNLGFTFEGQVGKEGWVSDNWGLGVSGRVLLGLMKDRPFVNEDVPTWKLAAFSVLFTATYN